MIHDSQHSDLLEQANLLRQVHAEQMKKVRALDRSVQAILNSDAMKIAHKDAKPSDQTPRH